MNAIDGGHPWQPGRRCPLPGRRSLPDAAWVSAPAGGLMLRGRVLVAEAPELIAVLHRLHGPQPTDQGKDVIGLEFPVVLPLQGSCWDLTTR